MFPFSMQISKVSDYYEICTFCANKYFFCPILLYSRIDIINLWYPQESKYFLTDPLNPEFYDALLDYPAIEAVGREVLGGNISSRMFTQMILGGYKTCEY